MPNLSLAHPAFETEFPVSSRVPAQDYHARCEPDGDQQKHMFHWLVFAEASPARREASGVGCDLWRWHRGEWRSVFVAGATFTPEEMEAQGWRYCAPNVQLFVNFTSAPKDSHGEFDWADAAPKNAATVPPKRKRTHSLAASTASPARPRESDPVRRGALRSV